ncbi:MAG TPA: efflux RND transporter periplasmic adaptor subunit [Xanthobacteraceae bacterium]
MDFVIHHNSVKEATMKLSIARLTGISAIALGTAGAVALLPLLAVRDNPAASTATAPQRPVQVQRVAFENDKPVREFVGVVRARHETDLGFRVAGKIIARSINMGDTVHAGDVVARLDPQDLNLQVESAQAELSAATSNLADASAEEARYASLKLRAAVAAADYDHKKAAKDEAQGRLERAQRALDLARNQLAYAELKVDVDGVITAALAEPGQVVNIGQAVARLAHHGEKEALVALPETWLEEARKSNATVALWSAPDRSFAAHLRELSPQADPTTRTYAARFTIENPDDAVALGMTATVRLARPSGGRLAKLPLSAVLNRGAGPSVYLVDAAGALVLRPVTVASFTEDAALVSAGIADGDEVVTLGVQKLAPGTQVRTVDAR